MDFVQKGGYILNSRLKQATDQPILEALRFLKHASLSAKTLIYSEIKVHLNKQRYEQTKNPIVFLITYGL